MPEQPDRHGQLLRMGEAFRAAAAAADWSALGEHAHALAPRLQALAARGPWSAAERQALQRLRGAHDEAAAAAATASGELALKLEQLRSNKDGWIASAMHSDTESA